ncbi:MAG: DUF1538 domain-containing protein [Treponema sp.]|nr:DUF1538 domain-containing protein [Treponema sp.]
MNLLEKFKETVLSVVPIMAIVLVLGLTVAPLGSVTMIRFVAGGLLLIIGLTIFLLGVDIGILPIGERSGAALTAKRNLALLLGVSFVIGFMVTIAEPDVQVLADQIGNVAAGVNKWVLVCMIAIGVGLFVMLGLLRTVLSLSLRWVLVVAYVLLFVLAFFSPAAFQGVAFDAGGATTGPMTVPFIMALGVGVAAVRSSGKKEDGDNSFGLTGIASIGPIAAVCVYGIVLSVTGSSGAGQEVLSAAQETGAVLSDKAAGLGIFVQLFPEVVKEVSLALMPLVVMFVAFQIFLVKMPPFQVRRMISGLVYSFVGLIIFLVGVNGGFMPAGQQLGLVLGQSAVSNGGIWIVLLVAVGFVFGAVVVCAEPAVWVLTEQVESVSGGTIKRKVMLIALSAGVALSIGLSMLRVFYGFSLWYILLPGYALALILTFFCPPLFTGIAFDSGGVASGPMTSTFILSFTLGVASSCGGSSVTDAFGVIALVAMTPLIAIQILGIIFKNKSSKTKNPEVAR